jgi:ADP-heptose:LPS heptosyltransferase/glycosyltransferase involved in cell wall biosynthesis
MRFCIFPALAQAISKEQRVSVVSVRVSLAISTLNRVDELTRLLDSLVNQDFKNFEVVFVDQNRDDRIVPVLARYRHDLSIRRVVTPTKRGISAGRNEGWHQAHGEIVVFPDDDCWYPPWFLSKGVELLDSTGSELVSGRVADETGRSINGRFSSRAHYITRRTVWVSQSEAATFYRRKLLEDLEGFDEGIGIGSPSPWQAAEGPDFVLEAINGKRSCYYDPSLYGYHREYDLDISSNGMLAKGRGYARGMGYVLRRHGFGPFSLIYWASRPLFTALRAAITGRFHRAAYALSVSLGRVEGWSRRTFTSGARTDPEKGDTKRVFTEPPSRRVVADRKADINACFGKTRREMTGPYRARNPLLVAALFTIDACAMLLPRQRNGVAKDGPLRVLVVNWGHLGDVVTILPLLKFLQEHPRVKELGVLVGSWTRPVLEASNIVAEIHVIDHWSLDRSNKSIIRKVVRYWARYHSLIRELRQRRYDVSIDTFSTFPASHSITWLASITRRIGFVSGGMGRCLTDPFDWVPNNRRLLEHQLELLKPLLGDTYPKFLAACYPGFNAAAPQHLLGFAGKPYIVIHMGPGVRGWVPEKWVTLASTLGCRGYQLVATGVAGEEQEAARALNAKVPIRDMTGQLSWSQFVATVAAAAAVITIDSAAGHIAACFGVPAVVLATGRQRIGLWRPNDPKAIMITHQVGCAPCNRSRGCAAMACVKLIDVEDVLSAMEQVIKLPPRGVTWSVTIAAAPLN